MTPENAADDVDQTENRKSLHKLAALLRRVVIELISGLSSIQNVCEKTRVLYSDRLLKHGIGISGRCFSECQKRWMSR